MQFREDLTADDEPPPAPEMETQQSTIDSLDEQLNQYDGEEGNGETQEDETKKEDDDEPAAPENAEDGESDAEKEEADEEIAASG